MVHVSINWVCLKSVIIYVFEPKYAKLLLSSLYTAHINWWMISLYDSMVKYILNKCEYIIYCAFYIVEW